MALESATYINGLVATNPASGDAVAQADDHLRLIKATLKATFPNITGPVTVTQSQINAAFPSGGIIMWSGSSATIPSGWVLCDGNNSTPDLRGRFVVGAGGAYDVGNNGGNSSITLSTSQLPSHNHGATFTGDALGTHSHTGSISSGGTTGDFYAANRTGPTPSGSFSYGSGTWNSMFSGGGGDQDIKHFVFDGTHNHTVTVASNSGGTPTGSVSVASTGSGASIDIRNPYYALCYIMKV